MTKCPNVNHADWKALVAKVGETKAWEIWLKNDEELPTNLDDIPTPLEPLRPGEVEEVGKRPPEVTELEQIFSDILIPGFTAYTQNEVVTHLTEQVLIALKENPSIDFNAAISKYIYWAEDKVAEGATAFEPIIENIDKFRKLVKDRLDRIGILKSFTIDQSEITIEGDTVSDSFYWEDDWVFKFDTKSNAQKQIKQFLLFIPKTSRNDSGEYVEDFNFLNTKSYMSYDEVFEELKAILSDIPNTWDAMKATLEEYQEAKPWIYNLLFQISEYEGDTVQLQNQFVTTFASTYSASKTVIWNVNQGAFDFKVVDTDQNAVQKTLINKWKNNFNLEDFHIQEGEEIKVNQIRVQDTITKLSEIKEKPTIAKVKKTLELVGIEISERTAGELIDGKIAGLTFERHFTSNRGLFKLIEDRLQGKDKEGLDIDEVINPSINNSAVRALAAVEVKNNRQVYSNSYLNGEGNTVYSYSLGKYLTKQFQRLKDKSFVEQMSKITFQAPIFNGKEVLYKSWIYELLTNESFKEFFEIAPFDTIKNSDKSNGIRVSSMSDIDIELTKLALFQKSRSPKGVGRITNYLFTVPSKTTSYIVTANAVSPNLSFSGSQFKLGKTAKDALYNIALSEHSRILSAVNRDIKTSRYKTGAKYFYFFPTLNKETTPEIWNSDGTVKLPTTTINGRTVENIIREKIETIFKEDVAKKVQSWEETGFITDGKLSYADQAYKKRLVLDDASNNITFAADYLLNNMLFEFNMHQVFIGDPALYYSKSPSATWDEIGKRLAAQIAPGRDIALTSEQEKFISIKAKDKTGDFALNKAQLKARLKEAAAPYETIDGTDAQEYTTLKEHLYVLYKAGLIPTEVYKNVTKKAKALGDNLVLTPEELTTVLQPLKPVYVETEVNTEEDVISMEYVKSSSIPLIPQFTKGLQLDTIRKAMESLEKTKGYPVRLAFDSATKVGGVNSVEIFDDKGNVNKNLNFENYHKVLPRTGFRIQQDVPYDPDYEFVVKSSQATKLLFDNVKDKQLLNNWTNLHEKLFKLTKEQLHDQILNAAGELDIAKIQDLLVREATLRAYSPAEVAALSVLPNGNFEYPFWATVATGKYESILTSLYTNNIIKQKMHGHSLILVSEEGIVGKSEGIVYTKAYDPTTGLKPMTINEQTHEVSPAQVLVPWRFKQNINKFLTDDGYIDSTKISPELLVQFGFRIPNQGHNSMALIEVVGFLPEVMGDAVIAPRNFITQMGSDFDVDKLYIYNYFTTEVDGKLEKDTNNTINSIKNDILDVHKAILRKPEVFNQVITPLENVKDTPTGKYLKQLNRPKLTNYLSPDYKKAKYLQSVDGKAMVGITALANTLNGIIQPHDIYFQSKTIEGEYIKDYIIFGDENGKRISLGDLSTPLTWRRKQKSQIISARLSAAVDNEKDPIMSDINANPTTAPAIQALEQVGFEEDHIYHLMAQAPIREVVRRVLRVKSSIGEQGRRVEIDIINQIKSELLDAFYQTVTEAQAAATTESSIKYYPLTVEDMKEMLKDKSSFKPAEKAFRDLVVITKFSQAYSYGESLQEIQRAINIESKGVGKSVLEVSARTRNVERLFKIKNIANVIDVLGTFTNEGLQPNTYSGHIIKEGLVSANNTLGDNNDLFKYNSRVYKTILREFEKVTGQVPTIDQSVDLWNNLKSFIYAKNLRAGRKELFFGKDSLARRIKKYMATSKEGASNPFLLRLNFEIATTTNKPDFVSYAAAKEEYIDEINIYQGLLNLFIHNNEEVRKLGEDLVSYFYANGGIQKAREWGKYIHPAYLKKFQYGSFLDALKDTDFQELNTIGWNSSLSSFMLQYFQHKAYLIPQVNAVDFAKVKEIGNKVTIPSTAIDEGLILPIDEEGVFIPIFSVLDKNADKGRRLYFYEETTQKGDLVFARIGHLGTTNFVEYSNVSNHSDRGASLVNKNIKPVTKVPLVKVKDVPINDTKSIPTEDYSRYEGDLNAILSDLSSSNPITAELKKKNFAGYTIKVDTSINAGGTIIPEDKTIIINPPKSRSVERTIVHEAVHAATFNALRSVEGLSPEQVKAVNSLKTIADNLRARTLKGEFENIGWKASELNEFDQLVRNTNRTAEQQKRLQNLRPSYYGLSQKTPNSLYDEFVAELFTAPEFQEKLNQIKYDSNKTLIDRILELIASIISAYGAKPDTAFESALHEAIILVSDKKVKKSLLDFNKKDILPTSLDDIAGTLTNEYKKLLDQFASRLKFIDQSISKAIIDGDKLRVQQLTNRKEEVEQELAVFEEKQVFSSVLELADKDLSKIDNIFKQGGLSHNDINYTLRVIKTWAEATDLILTDQDIIDNNQRAQDIDKVVSRAANLYNRWVRIAKTSVLKAVQEETGMKNLTKEVVESQDKINAITANLMDISRSGNILLSVMDKWMREASYRANLEAKEVHDTTLKLVEELKTNSIFKKDGYYTFAQTTEDGKLTGELVHALTAEYYITRNGLLETASNAANKEEKRTAWGNYFKWVRENHSFVDIRKLFEQDNTGAYTYKADSIYLAKLKKDFEKFDEILEEQKLKIQNYNERLALKIQSLDAEDPNTFRELEKWKARYDPSVYLRNTLSNQYQSTIIDGVYVKNEGQEFVVKRAAKKWEDTKYNKVQSSPELKAFYDHTVKTLNHLYSFLPPIYKEGVNSNTIPSIPKSVTETFSEKGMNAAMTSANNRLIDAISVDELATEVGKLRDPITKKPEQSLRVRYLTDLSPEEKSYDLGKVVNMFASEALSFKHKSTVEDSIRLAKSILEQGLENVKNPNGLPMQSRFGEVLKVKDSRNLLDQAEYAIEAFYGHHKETQGVSRKRVYKNKAKSKATKLGKELEAKKQGTITTFTPETQKFIEELNKLYPNSPSLESSANKYVNENTRYVAGSRVGDVLLKYMQLKGMGWNVFGSTTNVVFGWFSNMIHGAGAVDFNTDQILQANRIMLAATGRGVGLDSTTGRKINSLMVKFDVLKELNDAAYGSLGNTNRVKKGMQNLSPFELQRRGEYFVQGMTLIASMLNTKVQLEGKEVNLWEAFDNEGNFKDKENKDWNVDFDERTSGKEQFKFKFKLDQVNKAIHGNYDTNSPVRIKKGILGRATMQFRSWIAEGVANRVEDEKYDLLLGRLRRGRWRTYTDLGFVESFKGLLRLARGKALDLSAFGFDDKHVVMSTENMRRNLAEIYQSLSLIALYYVLKSIELDDDDEWGKRASNFTLNQILRLQDDIEFYYSPLAVENITQNFIPVFTLIRDGWKFKDALEQGIINGEWEYKTGKKAGESRVLWTGAKVFPFGSSFASFINKTENEEGFRK